jgi:hypothetical protein
MPSVQFEITVSMAPVDGRRREERDARVVTLELDRVAARGQPEPEAVLAVVVRWLTAGHGHLGEDVGRHDPSGEQRGPERAQVRERREQPAVADAAQRDVELVRPQPICLQVAGRRPRLWASDRWNAVSTMPAGAITRSWTSWWYGAPAARSARIASRTKPPLLYANRSSAANTVG